MSRLYLVRHAQASFLEQTYDKLSPLGETQSRLLGEFWSRHKIIFDRVCSGPCVRQKDTAKITADAYQKARLSFPSITVMPEFDEYQGEAVLDRNLPALIESDPGIRAMHQSFQAAKDPVVRRRTFQKLFEAVIGKGVEEKFPQTAWNPGAIFPCASIPVSAGFSAEA